MIPFRPELLISLTRIFGLSRAAKEIADLKLFGPWRGKTVSQIQSLAQRELNMLPQLREDCASLGLTSSVDQIDRIAQFVSRGITAASAEYYWELREDFENRILDDLSHGLFFMVPPHKRTYWADADVVLGGQVNKAFPQVREDAEEAAKCFAFGRNTAVVFHLMRVMEVGLRALGNSLNDPTFDPKVNPSWDAILTRCDRENKLPVRDRSPEWRSDPQFYESASSHLYAVKNAWRNPTMHIERNYDEDEALSIIHAVKGFMQSLAIKLAA